MRKLSKKISMLMVLAMLVGLFSGVVSASAASAWSFASGKYAVAVNGSINMESKEYADFDLLKDGAAPAGYTVAWASSDEDVVWVNAKTGQLRANKFGKAADGDKAVISATFTNTATKKSATRSFTIVLGAAKADFTVEAADVTIALGEEVKFAPVVKDAAGNVVKFATHKSYNGYFLDGKAIANPWTPEEAGEYTVTVAQFAKKADVTDLAKAVRKDEVKVTVTVDTAFDAKATGLKEITAYGEFAKDAKITVKRGNQNISAAVTVAEDGKSAVLALDGKLRKGTYTVACGDAKVDLAVEDEKVDSIVVFENGSTITTGKTGTAPNEVAGGEAYVHYDVLNQYGESVRKMYDIRWTASTGTTVDDTDTENGLLVIPAPASTPFIYGNTVILTGVYTPTSAGEVKTVNATMTIGLENCVSGANILGITKEGSGVIIDELPANFIDNEYLLVFELVDRLGYPMDYSDSEVTKLTFTSYDPLKIKSFDCTKLDNATPEAGSYKLGGETINGTVYGALRLSGGINKKLGGNVDLKVTSNMTGQPKDYVLKIASAQVLADFRILPPDFIIAEGDNKTLAYEAFDTEGNPITDFRVLYKSLIFSSSDLKLVKQNDGSAVLGYTAPSNVATKDYDYTVVYNVIIPETGKSSNVSFSIKDARYAAGVKSYEYPSWGGNRNIIEGGSDDVELVRMNDWADCLAWYDQYDEAIDLKTNKIPNYVAIKIDGTGLSVAPTGWRGAVAVNGLADAVDGWEYFSVNTGTPAVAVSFTASEATDTTTTRVVEFALADATGKIVSGSSKKIVYTIVDLDACTGFSVGMNDALIENSNAGDDTEATVTGTLANGSTVAINGGVKIVYTAETYAVASGETSKATIAVSGAAIAQKFTSSLEETVNESNKAGNQFFDLSVVKADGSHPSKNVGYTVTAEIYNEDGLTIKDRVTTTFEAGAFDRAYTGYTFSGWCWKNPWLSYNPWTKANTDAIINATNGVISQGAIMGYIDKVVDNYGDNGGDKALVSVSISKLTEGTKGLDSNNLVLLANDQKSNVPMISGAEIGDTFTATYTYVNGNGTKAVHVVNFTVGADTAAQFYNTDDADYTAFH